MDYIGSVKTSKAYAMGVQERIPNSPAKEVIQVPYLNPKHMPPLANRSNAPWRSMVIVLRPLGYEKKRGCGGGGVDSWRTKVHIYWSLSMLRRKQLTRSNTGPVVDKKKMTILGFGHLFSGLMLKLCTGGVDTQSGRRVPSHADNTDRLICLAQLPRQQLRVLPL